MTPPTAAAPEPPCLADPLAPLFLDVLARYGEITIALSDRVGDNCGVVDLQNAVILLNRSTGIGKRRATLVHELLHLLRPDLDDFCVEAATADVLVSRGDAIDVATGAADAVEVADAVGVDPQLVRARVASLHSARPAAAS